MATYSGKDGKIFKESIPGSGAFTTEYGNIRGWSITSAAIVATGAHSSSNPWTDSKAGNRSWSGTFEFYDSTGTGYGMELEPAERFAMQFQDGTYTYTGMVVIGDMAVNDDIEGSELVSGTYSFTGHGVLTIDQQP